jgi:hypothetical protein
MRDEVALIFGGSENVYAEYEAALALCKLYSRTTITAVCNSALAEFPGEIDYFMTLHPDQISSWAPHRLAKGLPPPKVTWAHRPATNVHRYTRDWGGSCSLFAVKVLRQEGFTQIILCGCPMTVEDGHFRRHERWNAATAFQRGWRSHKYQLPPQCVRSMSGWTQREFEAPDGTWLESRINVPPLRTARPSVRA